jgi:Concanavalin A-like lectin/glucanases superfamily
MKKVNRKLGFLVLGSIIIASSIISSCSKSSNNGGNPPPPPGPTPPTNPGGYDSSAQISAATLVAFFPFEGSYNDVKGGLTGTNHGGAFTTGLKGQAYAGSGQSFVTFANPGGLATLKSYTISAWFKIAAQPVNNPGSNFVVGQGTMGIFAMYDSISGNPNLMLLEFEPYTPVSNDSVRVHAGFNNTGNTAGAGYQGIIPEGFLDTAVGKWTQITQTYDGTSSMYTLYENGVAIAAASAWTKPTDLSPFEVFNGPTGGATTGPMGNINFKNPPQGFIIGGWPYNSLASKVFGPQPWAGYLQGALDNLRIYGSALNSSDVKSLYILEKAGF